MFYTQESNYSVTIQYGITILHVCAFTGILVSLSDADVYLHNPRGSNNRLNGAGAARANNNRLFDSQVSLKFKLFAFYYTIDL